MTERRTRVPHQMKLFSRVIPSHPNRVRTLDATRSPSSPNAVTAPDKPDNVSCTPTRTHRGTASAIRSHRRRAARRASHVGESRSGLWPVQPIQRSEPVRCGCGDRCSHPIVQPAHRFVAGAFRVGRRACARPNGHWPRRRQRSANDPSFGVELAPTLDQSSYRVLNCPASRNDGLREPRGPRPSRRLHPSFKTPEHIHVLSGTGSSAAASILPESRSRNARGEQAAGPQNRFELVCALAFAVRVEKGGADQFLEGSISFECGKSRFQRPLRRKVSRHIKASSPS